ncbi:DPH2 family protein [Megaselia abdita]
MTSSAFSSAEQSVLERETETNDEKVEFTNIWSEKQQNECIQWIKSNQFSKVCLQFPDDYLPFSTKIVDSLTSNLEKVKAFVLADTSYGSCCVDEVSFQPLK